MEKENTGEKIWLGKNTMHDQNFNHVCMVRQKLKNAQLVLGIGDTSFEDLVPNGMIRIGPINLTKILLQ